MGRGTVETKRIENRVNRQVTFSKRRKGLLKKAHELAVLCDVQVAVIIFSENGKLSEYSNPPCSLSDLFHRYEATTNTQLQEAHCNNQQMLEEVASLTNEKEQLESWLRIYTAEDLSPLASVDELSELERHLESALRKVRARKHELLSQLLDDLRRKTDESGHDDGAAGGIEMEGTAPSTTSSGSLFPMEPVSARSTALQLWPQPDSAAGGLGSCSPRGAASCRTRASPGSGLQLW